MVNVWTVKKLVESVNDCLVLEGAVVGGVDGENDALTTFDTGTGLVVGGVLVLHRNHRTSISCLLSFLLLWWVVVLGHHYHFLYS